MKDKDLFNCFKILIILSLSKRCSENAYKTRLYKIKLNSRMLNMVLWSTKHDMSKAVISP